MKKGSVTLPRKYFRKMVIEKGKIALAFTDMVLPDMDGVKVIKKLSEHTPDLKYILCSGYTQNNRKAVTKLQGEDKYLQKPYSIIDLLKIVKKILS